MVSEPQQTSASIASLRTRRLGVGFMAGVSLDSVTGARYAQAWFEIEVQDGAQNRIVSPAQMCLTKPSEAAHGDSAVSWFVIGEISCAHRHLRTVLPCRSRDNRSIAGRLGPDGSIVWTHGFHACSFAWLQRGCCGTWTVV